jgi:PAS domain-containing protein
MDAAAMGHSERELATGKVIWSQNHFALLGLDPAETVPSLELWRSLVHPDDIERVLEAMEVGRRGHTTVALEYRIHRADNHRVDLAVGDRTIRLRRGRRGPPVRRSGVRRHGAPAGGTVGGRCSTP